MPAEQKLLTQGSGKLGEALHVWSLPAVSTCPGSTPTCRRECYAKKGRFSTGYVLKRLRRNLAESKKPDFVERIVREVVSRGVLVLRIHASGDLYDVAYAEKWLRIIRACPRTVFYLYSRSHAVPEIAEVLGRIAAEKNAKVWFSVDADLCASELPPNVRVCYLQTELGEKVGDVDLVFRTKKLRGTKIGLPMLPVCPNEVPEVKKAKGIVCGSCQKCFRD